MPSKKPPLAMSPSGYMGHLFGWLMEISNNPQYRLATDLLNLEAGDAFMEIGFGTGKLLAMLAKQVPDIRLAGIEPTETMLNMALQKKALAKLGSRLDLRLGTADTLPWLAAWFDAVAALHCFQFWGEPQRSIVEINRVLKPQGRLVLILRDHSKNTPNWLPNPISRSGDEYEATRHLLVENGFHIEHTSNQVGSSNIILATKIAE